MNFYKALNRQEFSLGEYSIVPIRSEDRYRIMEWRNEQMYHLRQNKPLTERDQEDYFQSVIANLFEQEKPGQILFSYLKDSECIGYGGLVHINWFDKNAEISFIMNTKLEKKYFEFHWIIFLDLIEQVAKDIKLHKVFTYAFDLRPHLYKALEKSQFKKEAVLKQQCIFEGKFHNVVIHSKIFQNLLLRKANKADVDLTYKWVNDSEIRSFSFNRDYVENTDHKEWFYSKLMDDKCEYYIMEHEGKSAGSIRFDINEANEAKINYLIDPNFMGRGLGTEILNQGMYLLQRDKSNVKSVYGYVFEDNKASVRIFEKLKFNLVDVNGSELKYEKELR